MTSEQREPDQNDLLRGVIEDLRASAAEQVDRDLKQNEAIAEKLDALVLLIEQLGRNVELRSRFEDYVNDLRDEVKQTRSFRTLVFWLSISISLTLVGSVLALIFVSPTWFVIVRPHLQIFLITSMVLSAVVLFSIIIKGTFRSRLDKNSDEIIPEPVKMLYEVFKSTGG